METQGCFSPQHIVPIFGGKDFFLIKGDLISRELLFIIKAILRDRLGCFGSGDLKIKFSTCPQDADKNSIAGH